MKLNREYLSKFLSNFTKKPKSQPARKRVPQPPLENKRGAQPPPAASLSSALQKSQGGKELTEPHSAAQTPIKLQSPVVAQATPAPPSPIEMLDSVSKFLRQHLVCDEHQLTLLTLWVAHTWCFRHFRSAAYLHVRSAESQSAKTLCLDLLAALSDSPWTASGASWRSIMENLLTPDHRVTISQPLARPTPYTIFLDDYHHTFASGERQPVLGLLNSGSHADSTYVDGIFRYSVFGPKAFAGNSALPRSLASRCIPIVLRRKKPSDVIARFNPGASPATQLFRSLGAWAAANAAALAQAARQLPSRIPPGLSAREQDCAEPLLHIADRIGGPWPDRARKALVAAFSLASCSASLELLADIRAVFFLKDDPSHLLTRDLLDSLKNLEYRPWAGWTSGAARRMATLLHGFGIASRNFHKGSDCLKGYPRDQFLEAWERYLAPIPQDWHDYRAKLKKDAEVARAQTT